ncbi:stimulated by retinoic acid gene 6 protein-like isoform X1 [Acropora palmata]|uniref:stimulated by retinoic acid gene 6 protein-like isoform X1 n=1 Tax=Acropora palmata TaxID=6131 RepID=UPI003DA0A94E
MANTSANASSNLNASCTDVDPLLFELCCLGPSLATILILAFLKRRESYKLSHCNGYPGLVIPINFLRSSKSNRFAIAATFGATASTCLDLALSSDLSHINFFPKDSTPWVKVMQGLVAVLVYGIVFYPYFSCLTTKNKLIGSLIGFVYAAIRFSFEFVILFKCASYHDEITRKLNYLTILVQLPMLFCLLFILLRFAVLLGIQVQKQWFLDTRSGTCGATISELDEDSLLNGSTEIEHVSRLLNLDRNRASSDVKGLKKLLYYIYQPRSDFKFSTQFVSTLLVAGIALFEIAVVLLIVFETLKEQERSRCSSDQGCQKFWNIVIRCIEAACVLCSLFSAISLLHFMKCHRDHVFQLYRGERRFYQDVVVSPRALVGKSLLFPGYQIAYTIIGLLILLAPLLLIGLIAGFIVYLKLTRQISAYLLQRTLSTLPAVVFSILAFLFQLLLNSSIFSDRGSPNITINVANRQLFSIASYFFFFSNIILGLFSGVFRLLKALLLGIVFMSRIDRTCLMQGYQRWDGAYVAYLGFLNVLVAHSHPVMLVFCHLLIKRNSDRGLEQSVRTIESSGSSREQSYREGIVPLRRVVRFSQKAANRWLLAIMLHRNPSLRRYRRQGGATCLVDMRGASTNSVVEILS